MGFLIFVFGHIALAFILTALVIYFLGVLSFFGTKAKIERAREELANCVGTPSNEVINQALSFNQQIASAHEYRKYWWSRWYSPKGWEAIEFIDIFNLENVESRLDIALGQLGVTEKTPSHVAYNLLTGIQQLAVINNDSELESTCKVKMNAIQHNNAS